MLIGKDGQYSYQTDDNNVKYRIRSGQTIEIATSTAGNRNKEAEREKQVYIERKLEKTPPNVPGTQIR